MSRYRMSQEEWAHVSGSAYDYAANPESGGNYVGGPGDEWMQVPTAQEKKQGYLKTSVMPQNIGYTALSQKSAKLADQVNSLSWESAGTSPEVETLKGQTAALAINANKLAAVTGTSASDVANIGQYAQLESLYAQYQARYLEILTWVSAADPEPPPAAPVAPTPVTAKASVAHPPVAKAAAPPPPLGTQQMSVPLGPKAPSFADKMKKAAPYLLAVGAAALLVSKAKKR
jgi:hypothetical protein